ncbi:ABC transporter ATP-binding protein [Paenibacillus agricola]|uniref:ABC transporter ATP-binding protein n=1 Tax=Paenibacillus agricola TaxID=2716264 RepID=A0ABX0J7C9_9BACL|nr:ABC transporter ATP-binding protein [Paenibacillus agricola]NHN31084.1 ABC transporter ATP-binding protein [Paenibacillus agricola]
MQDTDHVVLDIQNLVIAFEQLSGDVTALRGVNFQLKQGEILGLVGESGCGKSLTALSSMKLLPKNAKIVEGDIRVNGRSLKGLSESKMREIRGKEVSMIFQEPMTALNPLIPIGRQIEETLLIHMDLSRKERYNRVIELLNAVGIPEPQARFHQFPYELSGGMRQRVMIATALACGPKVIIADEPTTALDVTIQAQMLKLLRNIRDSFQTSILLITHDMGVIADLADRVAVMYAGKIVEIAPVEELFDHPTHPYTVGLLNSIPSMIGDEDGELQSIPGSVPDLKSLPIGCSFQARCLYATDACIHEDPALKLIGPDHSVACWNPLQKGEG